MRVLLAVLVLALPMASAKQVVTHDFFRISQTVSRSASTPGAWRYTISPRGAEAKAYWEQAIKDWRTMLRVGMRVKLGGIEILRTEKGLRVLPFCEEVNPNCFSRPSLSQGLQPWKMDLILLDMHNSLDLALSDAKKHAKPYPATITLSKLLRFVVSNDGAVKVFPSGWRP